MTSPSLAQPLNAEALEEQRDMERLFGENGWYRLEKIWAERAATIREHTVDTVKTMDDVWQRRGQLDILEFLVRMREEFAAEKDARDAAVLGDDDHE